MKIKKTVFKQTTKKPSLVFFTGPMFSGKTKHLIKTAKYYKNILKKRILVFLPVADNRFEKKNSQTFSRLFSNAVFVNQQSSLVSHDLFRFPATQVAKNASILEHIKELKMLPDAVFFDEIHLFARGFTEVISSLQTKNINVFCSGLSRDFQNQHFPEIIDFLKLKPKEVFFYANCYKCFNHAQNSQRLVKNQELILVGGKEFYAPACNQCFEH